MGRRTKLTPTTHDRIIQAIRAGATLEAAAGAAGVHEATLHRWLTAGEAEDATDALRAFREDVYRARDELEVRITVGSVVKSALGGYPIKRVTRVRPDGTREEEEQFAPADGRVGLEILARRFHDRGWSRRNPVEITGLGGGPIQVEHGAVIAGLSERFRQLAGADEDGAEVIEGEVSDDDG
jgi:transposase-like protein